MVHKLQTTSRKSAASKALSSAAGRPLIGYLLFTVVITMRAEAAPTTKEIAMEEVPEGLCTAQGIQEFLSQTGGTKNDLELAYEHCRGEFLEQNEISPLVKQTIDQWVGTDLSKAEINQIFLAYELALVGPKPELLAPEFEPECLQMVDRFERYRDAITPLTQQVDINLDLLLSDGSEEVDEEEHALLNYVQYARFCRSLLSWDAEVRDADSALNEV